METHINSYRLNQKNKEYILTISIVGESIRITCKNTSKINREDFTRDFTLEQLKKLDQIFDIINTPYEALAYIDKALKIQKVGVSEEDGNMIINFYITTQGIEHQLEIPLGGIGASSNAEFKEKNELENYGGFGETVSRKNLESNQNINIAQDSLFSQERAFNESAPIIGPVKEDENQYFWQVNQTNNTISQANNQTNSFNEINSGGINLGSELIEGYSDLVGKTKYEEIPFSGDTGAIENIQENFQNIQFSINNEAVEGSVDYKDNGEINENAAKFLTGFSETNNQFEEGNILDSIEQFKDIDATNLQNQLENNNQYDYINQNLTSEYANNLQNKTTQYIKEESTVVDQLTTGIKSINTQDITQQFTDSTAHFMAEDLTTNQDFISPVNEYTLTTPSNFGIQSTQNQYLETSTQNVQSSEQYIQPSQDFQKPFITPADDNEFTNTNQTNNYYQEITTTTNIEEEPRTTTFSLPLHLEKNELNTTAAQTQIDLKPISDDKINKIGGTIASLQGEHQLIQDKLNILSGQINSYKNQLSIIENTNYQNEKNKLRAENMAIKQQLLELNNLRNDAAEARFLRTQISELEILRKQLSEMDILRKQLEEMNALKAKASELDSVKAQYNELNNLRANVSRMGQIQQQLGQLDALKAKVAELNRVKSQLGELDNLRAQAGQINILKQQINELTNLKINQADLEELRKKISELEKIIIEYEFEIKKLKEEQRRTSIEDQTRLKNTGMESRQLFFEDKSEQICVKGEIIHNTDELELLTRKINKSNKKLSLTLLYKATVDSDTAEAFHEKCDDAKSTLVLVETDKGKRFGGYTTCSWGGDCIDKKDEDAFVFSLDKMEIYENIPGEDAIGCYPKFGPIFLGCQIRIYDNAFTKGGTTFEKGLNYNTEEDFELTGGDRVFKIKEIEVYEVIPQ